MSAGLWIGVTLGVVVVLLALATVIGSLLGGSLLVEKDPRPPPRPYTDTDLLERLRQVEEQRFDLEGRLDRTLETLSAVVIEKRAVTEALVKIDSAAGDVLNASLAGGGIEAIGGQLHRLDEVRGGVWATYNAASDALKAADPFHPFVGETT